MNTDLKYLFGPILSTRLGRSLGINIIPKKICSLDCIYCEVGATTKLVSDINPYIKSEDIINEFTSNYNHFKDKIDVITVTGAGEPTLNSELATILAGLKSIIKDDKKIAILTNTTTLTDNSVYRTLLDFDIVVPSLDAVTQDIFNAINRPLASIDINLIVDKLIQFSHEFKGDLYLEILFVKSINDSMNHLDMLIDTITKINYNRLDITTISRPPAYITSLPLNTEDLLSIKKYFISKGVSIEDYSPIDSSISKPISELELDKQKLITQDTDLATNLLSILKMRPVTIDDISDTFKTDKSKILPLLEEYLLTKEVLSTEFNTDIFYYHKSIKHKQ